MIGGTPPIIPVLFLSGLTYFLLPFGRAAELPDTTVEIGVLPLFGGVAALFAHLGEMVGAILIHVGLPALPGDGAIVVAATLLFQGSATLLADAPVIVFTIFVANRTSPSTARF